MTGKSNIQAVWEKIYEIEGRPGLTSDDVAFLSRILDDADASSCPDVEHRLLQGYVLYQFGPDLNAVDTCEADSLPFCKMIRRTRRRLLTWAITISIAESGIRLAIFSRASTWILIGPKISTGGH
jgi:hypothetical protein